MLRSTSNSQRKWALALRREMQTAIGERPRVECEVPQELPPELAALSIRRDTENDPYADIVGTC